MTKYIEADEIHDEILEACSDIGGVYMISFDEVKKAIDRCPGVVVLNQENYEPERCAVISSDDFRREVELVIEECDAEQAHRLNDELMEKVLTSLGYGEGVELIKGERK